MRYKRPYVALSMLLVLCLLPFDFAVSAAKTPARPPQKQQSVDKTWQNRLALFQQMECLYGIPWVYLAAIDQYERTMQKRKKEEAPSARLTAITIPPFVWSGYLNPDEQDTDESSISFFGGIGMDGNGDGKADQHDDIDVLTTIIRFLSEYGYARDDFRIGLWMYYKRDRAVKTIDQFATIYDKYQTLDLGRHVFPIPRRYECSYNNTWGDARGWGGRRIHEGTDIFADYGTPVLSTAYGMIEVVGWNRFGGWRIGMRDMDNVYHYFAHLSAFKKGLKVGDIVEPGQVIGYVGSSGYGKPGTSGKFPPHLHYGMYRDMGDAEWAFDPYPYLKRWERQMRSKKKW
jgi:murein DD-endopeptidase MepM/ murein hydrolase activator NlpD